MVWTLSLPISILYFFGGKYLLGFFLNDPASTEAVMEAAAGTGLLSATQPPVGTAMAKGITFLRILSPFYFVIPAKLVADGVLRGSGRMGQFMAATFTDLALRVIGAIVLSKTSLGATGIWCAWPVGWTVATVMSAVFYSRLVRSYSDGRAV